jgi:hypothetical protein
MTINNQPPKADTVRCTLRFDMLTVLRVITDFVIIRLVGAVIADKWVT